MSSPSGMYELSIGIDDAAFTEDGSYFLRWSLVTEPPPPDEKYHGVFVTKQKNDSSTGGEIEDHIIIQRVRQERSLSNVVPKPVPLSENVVFKLGPDYIRNANGYQIMLLVEQFKALSEQDSTEIQNEEMKDHKAFGKGMLPVYPRPEVVEPMEGLETASYLFKIKQVIVLARLLTEEKLPVVCGRLRLVASLIKLAPEREEKKGPFLQETKPLPLKEGPDALEWLPSVEVPAVQQIEQLPSRAQHPSWDVDQVASQGKRTEDSDKRLEDHSIDTGLTSLFKFESLFEAQDETPRVMVQEGALGAGRESFRFCTNNYTSIDGTEDVTVIVYGAYNLPLLLSGSMPRPFASLRISGQRHAFGKTHATNEPTCNPSWHEALTLNIPETQVENCVLGLAVSDISQELLVNYHIPLSYLQPFYHHHLNLATPVNNKVRAVSVFATFIRRRSSLPTDISPSTFKGLEVCLHGIEAALKPPNFPMIIVARVLTGFSLYRSMVKSGMNLIDVPMEMVTFPAPHPSWIQVVPNIELGHPQVSLIGEPNDQPQWNHPFVFSHPHDVAAISSPGATLVFELYTHKVPNSADWKIRNFAGFSFIHLDGKIGERLVKDSGGLGVYIPNVLIEGEALKTIENKQPTLDFTLTTVGTSHSSGTRHVGPRLSGSPRSPVYIPYQRDSQEICCSEIQLDFAARGHPLKSDSMNSVDRWVAEYTRDKFPDNRAAAKLKSWFTKPSKDDLPTHDAIENLLPDYQYILPDSEGPSKRLDSQTPRTATITPQRPDDVERVSMSLLDYQQQELEKYRHAVHTMGQDIVSLRERIQELEATNSKLRRDVVHYNDSTRLLLDAQEIDGLSRPDIAERYVALKHNLNRTSGELRDYKDKVLNLQNELIKKNDREKEYAKLSDAHEGQQDVLRRLQERAAKVRRLEDVIRKQEKVIEKMEKMLNSRSKGSVKNNADNALNEALLEENKRLRLELEEATAQRPEQEDMDKERLQLYSKLERAESRIASLEKQLEDNARQWAREKSDLKFQLQEAEIAKSSSPRLSPNYDDVPKPKQRVQDESVGEPRRYSRYSRVPSPGRRNKPHIGYNTPLYDPTHHS